jgi:hypothetical protein
MYTFVFGGALVMESGAQAFHIALTLVGFVVMMSVAALGPPESENS